MLCTTRVRFCVYYLAFWCILLVNTPMGDCLAVVTPVAMVTPVTNVVDGDVVIVIVLALLPPRSQTHLDQCQQQSAKMIHQGE